MTKFITLKEALKYGHSERILNSKFELKIINKKGYYYSLLELEYYKETGEYPTKPLDGWANKPYCNSRNFITNYPKQQVKYSSPLESGIRHQGSVNGNRLM